MHNGMLQMGEEKMAKSVGNTAGLGDVLARWGRDAVVLFFSTGHYRQPLRFDDAALTQAQAGVRRLRDVARRLGAGASPPWSAPLRERFFAALAEDYNTPQALAAVWEWVRRANSDGAAAGRQDLGEMLGVLGLENLLAAAAGPPEEVVALARERLAAREARDFARADALRDELAGLGWVVRDTPGGFEFEPAGSG